MQRMLAVSKQSIGLIIITISHAFASVPYIAVGGGYGIYNDMYSNDGHTGISRLALGTDIYVRKIFSFGAEAGIQTSNRMRLTENTSEQVGIGSLPVFITIKPPLDLLALVKLQLKPSLFVESKLGAAYLDAEIDNSTIKNKSKLLPELQVGGGWNVSNKTRLSIYYQRIFGNNPTLTDVDVLQGTASLNGLPTLQSVLINVEFDL